MSGGSSVPPKRWRRPFGSRWRRGRRRSGCFLKLDFFRQLTALCRARTAGELFEHFAQFVVERALGRTRGTGRRRAARASGAARFLDGLRDAPENQDDQPNDPLDSDSGCNGQMDGHRLIGQGVESIRICRDIPGYVTGVNALPVTYCCLSCLRVLSSPSARASRILVSAMMFCMR